MKTWSDSKNIDSSFCVTKELMIIRSCWLLRQLYSLFSSVCLSHALFLRRCLRSSAAGRGIIFFLNFLCGSFSRHQHLTPSVTLFFFFFLPSSLESPTTSVNPSALVLALSRLPSCSHSIKPQTENVNTATRPSFKQHWVQQSTLIKTSKLKHHECFK